MDVTFLENKKAFLLILGGFASLLLLVTIKIANNNKKRLDVRKAMEKAIQIEPSLRSKYGDVDAFLNGDVETQALNFWREFFMNSIQPLLLLSILSLFDFKSTVGIIFLLALIIFSFAHEIFLGEKDSNKIYYRILIVVLWCAFYIISAWNYSHMDIMDNKPQQTSVKSPQS